MFSNIQLDMHVGIYNFKFELPINICIYIMEILYGKY